jgi:hypothetical protein
MSKIIKIHTEYKLIIGVIRKKRKKFNKNSTCLQKDYPQQL